MTPREITQTELNDRIQRGGSPFILLEALPEGYYQTGHLPGAVNLPPGQVPDRVDQLVPEKATEIVVYCSSRACRNSEQVAVTLTRLGYSNVRVFPGGKQEWKEAGLPFEV